MSTFFQDTDQLLAIHDMHRSASDTRQSIPLPTGSPIGTGWLDGPAIDATGTSDMIGVPIAIDAGVAVAVAKFDVPAAGTVIADATGTVDELAAGCTY